MTDLTSMQVEGSQASSLLKPADLQLLQGANIAESVTMPTALKSLSALIQHQESVEDQQSSLPAIQVQYIVTAVLWQLHWSAQKKLLHDNVLPQEHHCSQNAVTGFASLCPDNKTVLNSSLLKSRSCTVNWSGECQKQCSTGLTILACLDKLPCCQDRGDWTSITVTWTSIYTFTTWWRRT